MKLIRWLLQVILVVLVVFFGYHYLTKEELRSCISVPIATLDGKQAVVQVDQKKVDEFLNKLSMSVDDLSIQSEKMLENLKAVETTQTGKLSDQLIDKGQYLYCKTVVTKVEQTN